MVAARSSVDKLSQILGWFVMDNFEDALLKVMDHMERALVQLALAKQHKEHCTFVYKLKLVNACVYITAAIPYIRDIISSGHNVRVKK